MKKIIEKIKEAFKYKTCEEAYLSKSQDIYDVERRMKEIDFQKSMLFLGLKGH